MFTHSESPAAVTLSTLKNRNESRLEVPVKQRQIYLHTHAYTSSGLTGLKSHSKCCDVIVLDNSI